MCHNFKAVMQTSVILDVDMLVSIVAFFKDFKSIVIIVSAFIDFQLYAEKPLPFAIKYRFRLV